jgi:NAD(P)-dependent dehydrogenase (short-subunit alcohol dehydrogenase family)
MGEAMQRLRGKVAIVTGSAQGIGRGIALAFASEGTNVVVADINEKGGHGVVAEVYQRGAEAMFVRCDVGEKADIDATVRRATEAWSTIDILVNNAIQTWGGKLLVDVTDEEMDIGSLTGPKATLRFMQACYPVMKANGGGKIINIGSRAGIDGSATMGPYAAAKEAIRALTRVAAREWGHDHINVNTIVPYANSPAQVEFAKTNPEYMKERHGNLPLARVGDCEADIGRSAVFLASGDADYITGHTLMVDGGSCRF